MQLRYAACYWRLNVNRARHSKQQCWQVNRGGKLARHAPWGAPLPTLRVELGPSAGSDAALRADSGATLPVAAAPPRFGKAVLLPRRACEPRHSGGVRGSGEAVPLDIGLEERMAVR